MIIFWAEKTLHPISPHIRNMNTAVCPAGELLKKAQGYEVAEARDELRRMSQRTGGGQRA